MSELSTEPSLLSVPGGTWQLDPASSSVAFRHKSIWGLVTVRGTFPVLDGRGHVAEDGTAKGALTVDAVGVDTKHAKRDKHLRSAEFFDVDKHPTIDFVADEIKPLGATGAEVKGWLTVRGVTRPVSFTARATAISDRGVTLAATVSFDRHEYGMAWNQLGMLVGVAELEVSLRFTPAE
jgi:polyisoprenoid-binding protein YceI